MGQYKLSVCGHLNLRQFGNVASMNKSLRLMKFQLALKTCRKAYFQSLINSSVCFKARTILSAKQLESLISTKFLMNHQIAKQN